MIGPLRKADSESLLIKVDVGVLLEMYCDAYEA